MKHLSYTTSSKNTGSTQRLYRCFFVPLIYAVRHTLAGCIAVFGGMGKAQAPRCHRQLEFPHSFFKNGFQSKTCGGQYNA